MLFPFIGVCFSHFFPVFTDQWSKIWTANRMIELSWVHEQKYGFYYTARRLSSSQTLDWGNNSRMLFPIYVSNIYKSQVAETTLENSFLRPSTTCINQADLFFAIFCGYEVAIQITHHHTFMSSGGSLIHCRFKCYYSVPWTNSVLSKRAFSLAKAWSFRWYQPKYEVRSKIKKLFALSERDKVWFFRRRDMSLWLLHNYIGCNCRKISVRHYIFHH